MASPRPCTSRLAGNTVVTAGVAGVYRGNQLDHAVEELDLLESGFRVTMAFWKRKSSMHALAAVTWPRTLMVLTLATFTPNSSSTA